MGSRRSTRQPGVRLRTEVQLRLWIDRLNDTLALNLVNPDHAGAINRNVFLTVLRTQIPQLAAQPDRWEHAKRAVQAYVGHRIEEAIERLAAASGQPSSYAA
jgi:hypothetical protein